MGRREEKKSKEITNVPVPDARSNPGTVVIVNFDTNVASSAMKCPGRPKELTGIAVGKFIVFVLPSILRCGMNELKFVKLVIP